MNEPQAAVHHRRWGRREMVHRPQVRPFFVALACVAFGTLGLMALAAALDPAMLAWPDTSHLAFRLLMAAAGIVFFLIPAPITLWWLRSRLYGDTVCRLVTLPGAVGGWFKADIECRLPDSGEPVVVRLKNNLLIGGEHVRELWRMEEKLALPRPGVPKERRTIPVRLQVPRHPAQQPMLIDSSTVDDVPSWVFEIEQKALPIRFFVSFTVPVCEPEHGNPAEQRRD